MHMDCKLVIVYKPILRQYNLIKFTVSTFNQLCARMKLSTNLVNIRIWYQNKRSNQQFNCYRMYPS